MEPLLEKFIEDVAKSRKISTSDALDLFDKCVTNVAIDSGLSFSDVFNIAIEEEVLKECLRGSCNVLTIKQCAKSCRCAEYYDENGIFRCVSRKIKNAELINADPDRYVLENLRKTSDLKNLVHLASYLYYNYDGGGLSDNAFDALHYHLKKREKIATQRYEKIGAPPVGKIRTTLPYPMPSLTKVKPGTKELFTFLTTAEDISWSVKLDGVSGMLVYKNGELKKIFTRGDGVIGGDVSYLKDILRNIPIKIEPTEELVVRGEFVMSKQMWKKYEGTFSNARNFVSSRINSGYVAPGITDIDFVAYRILKKGEDDVLPPTLALLYLSSIGFKTVEHDIFIEPTVFQIMELYREKRETSQYYIDGLVLSYNIEHAPVKKGDLPDSPTDTVAFKMMLEEQIRSTRVLDVEWNISRHGRYVPVVIYESVYVNGVRMHRATGHNANHIRDWNMGKGTEIKVVRSGDVIPSIVDVKVNENAVPIMPSITYEWYWKGKDIVLKEIEKNRDVQIKRIVHFYETIGVPSLREKTAEKMWESGMKTAEAIAAADIKDFMKLKGFAKLSSEKLYKNVHEIMQKTPIDRYLVASTTFASGLGRKMIKQLFKAVPNIFDMSENEIRKSLKSVKGFGPKRIQMVAEGMPKFRNYLFSFGEKDITAAIRYNEEKHKKMLKEGLNPMIKGKMFVFTGFFGNIDYDLEDYIYDNDGDFASVVSSSTEAVVSANLMESTTKMKDAFKLGVKVLSLQEFFQKYNIVVK